RFRGGGEASAHLGDAGRAEAFGEVFVWGDVEGFGGDHGHASACGREEGAGGGVGEEGRVREEVPYVGVGVGVGAVRVGGGSGAHGVSLLGSGVDSVGGAAVHRCLCPVWVGDDFCAGVVVAPAAPAVLVLGGLVDPVGCLGSKQCS